MTGFEEDFLTAYRNMTSEERAGTPRGTSIRFIKATLKSYGLKQGDLANRMGRNLGQIQSNLHDGANVLEYLLAVLALTGAEITPLVQEFEENFLLRNPPLPKKP